VAAVCVVTVFALRLAAGTRFPAVVFATPAVAGLAALHAQRVKMVAAASPAAAVFRCTEAK
jgi:hypothetical protein